ncbi:hypothetical protein IFM89_032534 [Coptis chinensis]|uniref:SMP domain-containing protein n=1 Tax=Coptis chinensis TaxID=261450 RepID=A0A835IRQ2_9MAGN|nr:hypothetical protein IFM89_032534 [Coptis chinensis]
MMQAAENMVLGQTQKGGPAATMQSTASVTVTETEVADRRIITEFVAGQVVADYSATAPIRATAPASALDGDAVTIGEALEATAFTARNKPVDQSDAAAIQAAEVTGINIITPGAGAGDEVKTKLGDVLSYARTKLPADKEVTREDAEGVIGTELRNNPNMSTYPGGVADSMAAAARMNQQARMNP